MSHPGAVMARAAHLGSDIDRVFLLLPKAGKRDESDKERKTRDTWNDAVLAESQRRLSDSPSCGELYRNTAPPKRHEPLGRRGVSIQLATKRRVTQPPLRFCRRSDGGWKILIVAWSFILHR